MQDDILIAEGKEDHHLQTLKEAENLLMEKKMALERLNNQVTKLMLSVPLGQL